MKVLIYFLVCLCLGTISISADSKTENENKTIRQNLNELKSKIAKVELTKKSMLVLQEDIKASNVLDETTIKSYDDATVLMESISVRIKSANALLLSAELKEGVLRTSEVKNARKQIDEANEELFKVQDLLTVIIEKAQIIELITEIINELQTKNQIILSQIDKELSGEKILADNYSEWFSSQSKTTRGLNKLERNINNLLSKSKTQEEKDLLAKAVNILIEEKTVFKSKEVESKIEEKDLVMADAYQKGILATLNNVLKILSPEDEKVKDSNADKDPLAALKDFELKINYQIIKTNEVVDNNIGNPEITIDPNYDPLLSSQREINKNLPEMMSSLPIDPKSKAEIEKAVEAGKRAKTELDNGNPQKAVEENEKVKAIIAKTIKELEDKDSKEKNNHKKGDKPNKNDKPNNDKENNQNADIEIADINLESLPENALAAQFAIDISKVIIRANQVNLGKAPDEKEVWLAKSNEKNKAVLMQCLVDSAPKEYAEPTQKYFEVISAIGE